MKRLLAAALSVVVTWFAIAASPAIAQSTINPAIPATNAPLASAPVRSNFVAAYSDINGLLGMHAVPSLGSCSTQTTTTGADCLVTSSPSAYLWYKYTGSNGYVLIGTINPSTIPPTFSAGLPPINAGFLLANCTGSTAIPTGCSWSAFADQAISSSNGNLPYRTGGAWGIISTGVSGHVLPLLDASGIIFSNPITSGVAGSVVGQFCMANATSGAICLSPATGALGSVNATFPANNGVVAELNLPQTWTAAQTHTANVVVSNANLTLAGNISAPAWTTTGIRYIEAIGTLTDTTSTGTVAVAYTNALGGSTVAATSATIYTNYYSAYFKAPVAGSNVTFTNGWALGADSAQINGNVNSTGQYQINGAQIAASNLSNGVTGSGAIVLATAPSVSGLTVTTSFTATGLVGLLNLANQTTNTILANVTAGNAPPTALAVASCVGSANALQWVTNTGLTCQAITAAAGSVAIGTTTITSGTTTRVLFDNVGVLGEYAISGTGNVAMTTSPVFTTPNIGAATATSVNGLAITTSTGTLAVANAKTLTANNSITIAGTDGKTLTVSNSLGLSGTDGTTFAFPSSSDTVVTLAATQTLVNKTLTSPVLTSPVLGVATGTSLALGGCTIGANVLCTTGAAAISSTLTSAAHTITSASVSALAVGLNGSANPALQIDASTALSVTGIKIKSGASAGGVAFSVISSSASENLFVDALGTGGIAFGNTSTGPMSFARPVTFSAALTYGGVTFANTVTGSGSVVGSISPTFSGSVTTANINAIGTLIVQSAAAEAVAFGASGATNPAFWVDASTASSVTGLKIKSAAAAGGVALSVISSGSNENVTIDALGTGTVTINGTATGAISLARNTSITGTGTITSASASAFAVGLNGASNSAFLVNASTASQAAGLSITGAATGGVVAIAAIDSGANTSVTLNAKGTGTIGIGSVSTGAVTITPALTLSAALTYGGVTFTNAVTGTGKLVGDTNSTQSNLTVTTAFTATGLVTYADMASAAIATQANYFAGAASVLVAASGIYTPEITTTFAASQTIDFSTFINTVITLTANMTSMTLSNVAAGKAGQIRFVQDGTGSRLFSGTWPSAFKWAGGSPPTFGTNANESDNLQYNCTSATYCTAFLVKDAR